MSRILEMTTQEGDLVLDFFAESGTTAIGAGKLGGHFIAVEQMDCIEELTRVRKKKVFEGEQGSISKAVEWQGGSFVYADRIEAKD